MNNYKLVLLGFTLLVLASCSTESPDTTQQVTIQEELQSQLDISADAQEPAAVLDNAKEGIYHGIIASGNTLSRGKVWLNLGNNTEHTATVTMVDGMTGAFTGVKVMDNDIATYHFTGEQGSFTVTENTVNQPEITDVILNDDPYFMYAIKSTSQTRATAYTGTFSVTGGNASGTWNIISNGVPAPNGGVDGTAISDLVVTYNGAMELDNTFEIGDFCGSPGDPWTPIVDIFDTAGDGILAFDQSSTLFGGETTWDIGYSVSVFTGSPIYVDNEACTLEATSGIFTWVSSPTLTQTGTILVD